MRRGRQREPVRLPDPRASFQWLGCSILACVVLAAPWAFGAWEAWFFWPFVTLIFLAAACAGAYLVLCGTLDDRGMPDSGRRYPSPRTTAQRLQNALTISGALFLACAFWRAGNAPVAADAHRSLLLFLTAALLGLQVRFTLTRGQRRLLWLLLLGNGAVVALYGLVNHWHNGSTLVLWRPGYPQYTMESRISGPFFCPDHYAGLLEMTLALALGALLTPGLGRRPRLAAAIVTPLCLAGILMSKSRGAGMTVLVMLAAVLVWGVGRLTPRLRRALRWGLPLATVAVLAGLVVFEAPYMTRFTRWFGWHQTGNLPPMERFETSMQHIRGTSRWVMWSGAIRAWREAPYLGIGPGMHQHIWPHVAASPDGNRATGRWPSRLNDTNYSYEAHNDWLQLLEEYGLVGFSLFAVFATAALLTLRHGIRRFSDGASAIPESHAVVLGGLLAAVAMAFHSLGDFNLQIPANTWFFAVAVALGLTDALRPRRHSVPTGDT